VERKSEWLLWGGEEKEEGTEERGLALPNEDLGIGRLD
jgi:hypothetical protein